MRNQNLVHLPIRDTITEFEKRNQARPVITDRTENQEIIEFNRAVLNHDLRRIKKNLNKLSDRIINELDNYFDEMCELAQLNASVFKSFFRRMLNERGE